MNSTKYLSNHETGMVLSKIIKVITIEARFCFGALMLVLLQIYLPTVKFSGGGL